MSHDGHRERLKKRFTTSSASFEDHELLELLLFYSIPRRNTNETAHALIERFGSIKGVFDASLPALASVDGMGDSSALFLRAVSESIRRYGKIPLDRRPTLTSTPSVSSFIKTLFAGSENEQVYAILLDARGGVLCCSKLCEGASCGSNFPARDLIILVANNNASSVILAHNHPNGKPIPSGSDIVATNRVKSLLSFMDVRLLEHYVFAEGECRPIMSVFCTSEHEIYGLAP